MRKREKIAILLSMALQDLFQQIRRLISRVFIDQEKQLLVTQMEKQKNQLQSALEHIVSQNQKSAEIAKKLQREIKENKTLWDQVEYLTTELNKERLFWEKHVCHREKAALQEAQNDPNNPQKQQAEKRKQPVEYERQQRVLQQQDMESYSIVEMTVAQNSELKQTCENIEPVPEETDQSHDTAAAEEKHKGTLLRQKLQEAESIISEQNVILDQIKQEIKLLQEKHHEETKNVSQLEKCPEAREECKQFQVLPLQRTIRGLREESRSSWRWNASRTC